MAPLLLIKLVRLLCLHQRECFTCRADSAASGEGPERGAGGEAEAGRGTEPGEEGSALRAHQKEAGAALQHGEEALQVNDLNTQNPVTPNTALLTPSTLSGLHQLQVHRQREKELSALSKAPEVAKHLQRWQNLLTAHSLELAELINNLDEEAAADIRKVYVTHSSASLCAGRLCLVTQLMIRSMLHCQLVTGSLQRSTSQNCQCHSK